MPAAVRDQTTIRITSLGAAVERGERGDRPLPLANSKTVPSPFTAYRGSVVEIAAAIHDEGIPGALAIGSSSEARVVIVSLPFTTS